MKESRNQPSDTKADRNVSLASLLRDPAGNNHNDNLIRDGNLDAAE